MRNKFFYIITLFLIVQSVQAQNVTWSRVYGGPYDDLGDKVIQTIDEGYLFCTRTKEEFQFGAPYYLKLIKTDYLGSVQWSKIYKDSLSSLYPVEILQTSDSGYYIFGKSYRDEKNYIFMFRTNRSGDSLWMKKYIFNNTSVDVGSINLTNDGGFIVCGITHSQGPPYDKIYILKLNQNLNLQWERIYNYYNFAYGILAIQGDNGFYYFTGYIKDYTFKDYAYIGKLSPDGQLIKLNMFGSTQGRRQVGIRIIQQGNQNIYIGGFKDTTNFTYEMMFLSKCDTACNLIWERGYSQQYARFSSMCRTNSGNFVLCGTTGGSYISLIKVNPDGNFLYLKNIPPPDSNLMAACDIRKTNDNGLIISGFTTYNGTKYENNIIGVKTDSLGNAPPIKINNIITNISDKFVLYQNYPNPFNPTTKIKFDIPSNVKPEKSNVKLIIYDILGREVATLVNEQLKPGTYEVEWDGSNYSSGIYYYSLQTETFKETQRMVLIK